MEGKAQNGTGESARVARVAWLVSFVVPMALIALLLAVEPSHASPAPLAAASSLEEEAEAQAESEEEGEVSEDQECLEAEAELAAGELSREERDEYCEDEGDSAKGAMPEECPLRSFHPQAVAVGSQEKLKLTIGYTTHEPADATIEIRNGSRVIDSSRRRLGRSGVIRLVEPLSDAEMDKVQAARRFTVRLHVTNAPDSCKRFETEQLTVKLTPQARASTRSRDRRR